MLSLGCGSPLQTRLPPKSEPDGVSAGRSLTSRCDVVGTSRVVTAPAGKLRALLQGGCPTEEEDRGLHAACALQCCVHLTCDGTFSSSPC